MQLLCRSNYSEEVWKSSFSENKAVQKNSKYAREGKSSLKKTPQIKLVIAFN